MRRGRLRMFTTAQCAELWRRYKAGESVDGIGRALGSVGSTVRRELQYTGGIAPAKRRRSARVLSLIEREEVSRGIAAGCTIRGIAKTLNRAPSTVSQEVSRHGGRGLYRAAEADLAAWKSARRPKLCLLAKNRELRVSHETIYRSLFVQARGVLKKELIGHLRSKRRIRRSRHATDRGTGRGQIVDAVSIRQRPAEVDDRAIPGHWEGDLVEGARGTFIATLVERPSRFVVIVKVPDKQTENVVTALIKAVRKLPVSLRRSLTWDRGTELANHAQFTVATDVQVYFCDPSSPWQRGSNENTNGLLRQYYPKGMDLSGVSQARLDTVARKLNTRPRETLHWKTPAYMLGTTVSTTH